MAYVLDVFMADTSSLKNRALVFGFSTTPYIVTTFIGPRAAESFVKTSGWRWAYGTYTIVTPVVAAPIMAVLWYNQRKATKLGLLVKEKSGRTFRENVSYYFWEFDGRTRTEYLCLVTNHSQCSACYLSSEVLHYYCSPSHWRHISETHGALLRLFACLSLEVSFWHCFQYMRSSWPKRASFLSTCSLTDQLLAPAFLP